jgi:hypothetical protein
MGFSWWSRRSKRQPVPIAPNGELLLGPPDRANAPAGYANSEEHLWDELQRIDQYVRAQAERRQYTLSEEEAEDGPFGERGDLAEIQVYLRAPFVAPHYLPPDLEHRLIPYWQRAESLAAENEARRSATPSDVTLRVDRLQLLFGLTDLERDILLVCLLPEVDARYGSLFGQLQDNPVQTRPTVDLVLQILYPLAREPGRGWFAFDTQAPLLANQLVFLPGSGRSSEPLPSRTLRLDDRIAAYLLGSDRPDGRLAGVITTIEGVDSNLPDLTPMLADRELSERLQVLAAWWKRKKTTPRARATIFLVGPDANGRRVAAEVVCRGSDTPLLVAHVSAALAGVVDWRQVIALSYREATLQGTALYWEGCETLMPRDQPMRDWYALVTAAERFGGLTFLASHTAWEPTGYFHPLLAFRLAIVRLRSSALATRGSTATRY